MQEIPLYQAVDEGRNKEKILCRKAKGSFGSKYNRVAFQNGIVAHSKEDVKEG
jgi:hypothetical protein